ncbi:hypothetical protein [Brachyspira sp. G79]|uniref:hypothetical protein n=1 Tax=Brachyspira sp. G79 TaxID=1358104 RepID=UPI000BBCBA5F|nr:hypothetical protein [Brachyspira sp. G79]PCG20996.1 hypothetical protein KQ44_00915 [Brachyspira sp. G79]
MINMEDLVDVEDANIKEDDWELYKVFKPMKVFGKHLETLFDIGIHKVWKLEDIINNLKSHVNILSDSREELKNAYGDFMFKDVDDDWYNNIDIYKILIKINEDGSIESRVECGDDENTFNVYFRNNDIVNIMESNIR